jgi:hypothetical protein
MDLTGPLPFYSLSYPQGTSSPPRIYVFFTMPPGPAQPPNNTTPPAENSELFDKLDTMDELASLFFQACKRMGELDSGENARAMGMLAWELICNAASQPRGGSTAAGLDKFSRDFSRSLTVVQAVAATRESAKRKHDAGTSGDEYDILASSPMVLSCKGRNANRFTDGMC